MRKPASGSAWSRLAGCSLLGPPDSWTTSQTAWHGIEMFRVDQVKFYMLCNTYGHMWQKAETHVGNTVSVAWRLAIYLSWMAFGLSQRTLAHLFGVSDTLVSEISCELTQVFSGVVYGDYVRLPVKDDL
ncbi:MAG: hypothetical protein J3K34DRAFT_446890 [Monoraphidium minutum]|nr:MAG: hypothetical protein J3K34DRAFT_446890 [Monoraphidium minutum]